MKLKKERPAVPYTYLIDNFKVLLIFLVVFNHIIAFNLVKVDTVVICPHLFLFRGICQRNLRMY